MFGPAFRRQSRWSVVTPVRELGDDKAPAAAVDGFYSFWFNFKSWREFPHPDEEDVEQAEGREHRCGAGGHAQCNGGSQTAGRTRSLRA